MVQSTDGTAGIRFKDDSAQQEFWYRGNTNAFYIENPTKLGLGTSDPKNQLHISGSDGTTSGIRQSRAGAKIWSQEIDSSGRLQWSYRSSEGGSKTTTFTLDDNNNVGIGTGAPNEALEVVGNISGSSTSTGSFAKIMLHYDDLPTSDPSIKGMVYRDGSNNLKISAG